MEGYLASGEYYSTANLILGKLNLVAHQNIASSQIFTGFVVFSHVFSFVKDSLSFTSEILGRIILIWVY